jgi:long-chain fatty acid transport protein
MNSKLKPFVSACIVLICGATFVHSLQGGGISLYEIATPDVGLASAGYAARADNASTIFKNPAGMSRLNSIQFQGGLQALYGSVVFSPDSGTSLRLGDNDGGNAIGWLPGASLFVVMPIGDKVRIGLGSLSYFGKRSAWYEPDALSKFQSDRLAVDWRRPERNVWLPRYGDRC